VPEGGIDALVRWMDDHPEHGTASPELVDRAGNNQCAARRFPMIWRSLIEVSRLHLLLPPASRASLLLGSYRRSFGDCVSADWVPATAVIVRPRAVREAGLLDETLPIYGADSEWRWRFRLAGWRIGVCGATRFRHDEGVSAIASLGRHARDVTGHLRDLRAPTRRVSRAPPGSREPLRLHNRSVDTMAIAVISRAQQVPGSPTPRVADRTGQGCRLAMRPRRTVGAVNLTRRYPDHPVNVLHVRDYDLPALRCVCGSAFEEVGERGVFGSFRVSGAGLGAERWLAWRAVRKIRRSSSCRYRWRISGSPTET
jgi:hypothetical protein